MKDILEERGRKLRAARAMTNESQADIAKLLDIGTSAYSMKEQGRRQFTETEINILLSHFSKKYENLFLPNGTHKWNKEGC